MQTSCSTAAVSTRRGESKLYSVLESHRAHPNLLLMLNTYGGSANSAFRIMRELQRRHVKITLFVSHICTSAGTLMAIGADELAITDGAQLGPLDVQMYKPDEIGERSSGLVPSQAFVTLREQTFNHFEDHFLKLRERSLFQLTTKTCAEIAAKITIGCMSPIFAQLEPNRLGELERALMIAYHYGKRLVRKNLKDGALEELVSGYPSHDFVIDKIEARKLFKAVRHATKEEVALSKMMMHKIVEGLKLSKDQDAAVDYVSGVPIRRTPKKTGIGSNNAGRVPNKTQTGAATRGKRHGKARTEIEPKPRKRGSTAGVVGRRNGQANRHSLAPV